MPQGQEIPRYTIEDYQHWKDDWEIINGYPYAMTPSPFFKHQKISGKLNHCFSTALNNCIDCNCDVLSELDWIINDNTIVRPDIMIVCDQENEDDFVRSAPSLIAEVFSTRTKLKDRNVKFNLYESLGVKYYLMVDPENKRIEFFELIDNKYLQTEIIDTFIIKDNSSIVVDFSKVFK